MLRLWINNSEVDLIEGETVALTLQANNVEDPSTFQSSFSNSFEIPLTRTNRQILGNAQAIGDNSTLYTKLPCRLEKDGLPIVSNGFAVINETSNETATITVFDGVADFFTEIGDRVLSELDLSSLNPTWDLTEVTNNTQNTWSDGYVWALANYGDLTTTTVDVRYQHPSIFVKYLFQEIASQFSSYSFVSNNFYTDSFFETLILPFHNYKGDLKSFFGDFTSIGGNPPPISYTTDVTDETFNDYTWEVLAEGLLDLSTGIADLSSNRFLDAYVFSFLGTLNKVGGGNVTITIKIVGVDSGTVYASDTTTETTGGGKSLSASTSYTVIQEPIKGTVSITFSSPSESFDATNVVFTSQMYLQEYDGTSFFGNTLPIGASLPDMTCKDFVKDIFKIFNVVPQVDPYLKTITLRTFEEYSTQTASVDYSSNVDTSKEVLREYQYGGFGLTNLFEWSDDNLINPGFPNGYFSITNALLDGENKWIDLKFAPIEATELNDELNIAQLVVYNSSLELAENLKPRLGYVKYYSGSPIPAIDFTDGTSTNSNVDFSLVQFANAEDSQTLNYVSLRDPYHDSFIKMLQKMEKLTLFLDFNAKEFRNIDFFEPVYLGFSIGTIQVNGVYLLQKIEDYEGGKSAKCEFIKLNPL